MWPTNRRKIALYHMELSKHWKQLLSRIVGWFEKVGFFSFTNVGTCLMVQQGNTGFRFLTSYPVGWFINPNYIQMIRRQSLSVAPNAK